MKHILTYITVCITLSATQACNKKTVNTINTVDTVTVTELEYSSLSNPIDSISKIQGVRHWHGKYTYEQYNATHSHVDWLESDTSLSFNLTVVNDSLITYSIFGAVDSLRYVRTNELKKHIFYIGDKFRGSVLLQYFYVANRIEFEVDGLDSNDLSFWLKLSTP